MREFWTSVLVSVALHRRAVICNHEEMKSPHSRNLLITADVCLLLKLNEAQHELDWLLTFSREVSSSPVHQQRLPAADGEPAPG